jgi:hypothetical protein
MFGVKAVSLGIVTIEGDLLVSVAEGATGICSRRWR